MYNEVGWVHSLSFLFFVFAAVGVFFCTDGTKAVVLLPTVMNLIALPFTLEAFFPVHLE